MEKQKKTYRLDNWPPKRALLDQRKGLPSNKRSTQGANKLLSAAVLIRVNAEAILVSPRIQICISLKFSVFQHILAFQFKGKKISNPKSSF